MTSFVEYSKAGYETVKAYELTVEPDVLIMVHNDEVDMNAGKFVIPLNSLFLSKSPFFEKMFQRDQWKESFSTEPVEVTLNNFDIAATKSYFRCLFLQTHDPDAFEALTHQTCTALRRIADYCSDDVMIEKCDNFIKLNVDNNNLRHIMTLNNKKLTKAVARFIFQNIRKTDVLENALTLEVEYFIKLLDVYKRKLPGAEMSLQALSLMYLDRYLKSQRQGDVMASIYSQPSNTTVKERQNEHKEELKLLITTIFDCAKFSSYTQRKILVNYQPYFKKLGAAELLADLFVDSEYKSTLSWHMLKPVLKYERNTNTVTLQNRSRARATMRANQKMCLSDARTYFEIRILTTNLACDTAFAIGCGTRWFEANSRDRNGFNRFDAEENVIGWKESYAYHSDNGGLYACSGSASKIAKQFTVGDVVGCGRQKDKIFFTKNGHIVGFVKLRQNVNVYPMFTIDQAAAGQQRGKKQYASIYIQRPSEYAFDITAFRAKNRYAYQNFEYSHIFERFIRKKGTVSSSGSNRDSSKENEMLNMMLDEMGKEPSLASRDGCICGKSATKTEKLLEKVSSQQKWNSMDEGEQLPPLNSASFVRPVDDTASSGMSDDEVED